MHRGAQAGGEPARMDTPPIAPPPSITPPPVAENPLPTTASTVWRFKLIRLETPEELSSELWEKLNAYVQILKPSKTNETSK